MNKFRYILAGLGIALASSLAQAYTINWVLDAYTLDDETYLAPATGTFATESTSGSLLSFNIVTTTVGGYTGFTYDADSSYKYPDNIFGPNSFVILSYKNSGIPQLNLIFKNPLTTAGTNPFQGSTEYTRSGSRQLIGNAISITPVPEPESYAMLLAGLGLLGFIARRRKQHLAA